MKRARQQKILEIINSQEVETQEDLTRLLKEAGFEATQATISRDIRQMKLSKVASGDGHAHYVAIVRENPQLEDKLIRVLKDGFVSMDRAQNILVMRTVSGMAMAVATAIDSLHFQEIVGCIAGDDTIMIVVRTNEDTKLIMDRFSHML